ncbi:MAG: leucine-rich repeat protein [Clostridia bacterium]|nr:leucine-rich repeat protein [Clostridia bacterium]
MKKLFAFISLTAVLFLFAAPVSAAPTGFSDVRETAWFYRYVAEVSGEGIMTGTGDGIFSPGSDLTRAEVVTILSRLSGETVSDGSYVSPGWADVVTGSWYEDFVGWASSRGVIRGYTDGTFRPKSAVTRSEFAVMTARFARYIGLPLPNGEAIGRFADADRIPAWASEDVELLRKSGLFSGDSYGRFTPGAPIVRSEVAAVVCRMIDIMKNDLMYGLIGEAARRWDSSGTDRVRVVVGGPETLDAGSLGVAVVKCAFGLDPEKYSVRADESALADVRTKLAASPSSDPKINAAFDISLTNNETGKKTETETIGFVFSVTDGYERNAAPEIEYKILSDGACEIVKFTDPYRSEIITLPSSVDGFAVTSIGEGAFSENRDVREIRIADGTKKICSQAFGLCTSLERVTIPDSVTKIGRGAFYCCPSLETVVLPPRLERVSDYAFYMCENLRNVAVPSSLEDVGAFAFNHTAVVSFPLPDGFRRIGDYSFERTGISKAILPESLEYLGNWAFLGCPELKEIYVPSGVSFIGNYVTYGCAAAPSVSYGGTENEWRALAPWRPFPGLTVEYEGGAR